MARRNAHAARRRPVDPIVYAPILVLVVVGLITMTCLLFSGATRSSVPLTVVSDRAGLVMEDGAKVKMHGVQVGTVASVGSMTSPGGTALSTLRLKIDPGPFALLRSDVEAEIKSSTAFGAKYVDLIEPAGTPARTRLGSGATVHSRNVTVEVNTVFENLESVVHAIDPAKLNSVLSAFAEALRGRGQRIGEAIRAANGVLGQVNPRMDTVKRDWQLGGAAAQAYADASPELLTILDALTTTSKTISAQSRDLDDVLLSAVGFGRSGSSVLGTNYPDFVRTSNTLVPTTDLLNRYSPTYTCLFQGAQWFLDHGGRDALGGNGKSVIMDAALLFGDDAYRYPDNLPRVHATGGPGGRPSCGSLPDVSANFPVKSLVTDTGWGTGLDNRPNPGIGFPGLVNYFPVTKAIPEPPKIRYEGGPAPGPAPGPPPPPAPAPDPVPPPTDGAPPP